MQLDLSPKHYIEQHMNQTEIGFLEGILEEQSGIGIAIPNVFILQLRGQKEDKRAHDVLKSH